jgi:glycosyltransferase involved in cell wall biosynthesis
MMQTALVTVVVPCYRCAATIERAVASVVAQTLRPAELILVDDASGDGTVQVLQSLRQRHGAWITVIEQATNGGAASARNAGWARATQPYVAFLDADDAWHPQKMEIQYAYMVQHLEVAVSGHLCRQLPDTCSEPPQWSVQVGQARRLTWWGLLVRHAFVTPSVMLRRDIPFRFASNQRYMEDHRLWLEIVGGALSVVKLEAELAAIYKPGYGASGLSANLWRMERGELSNYRYFFQQRKIPLPLLVALYCYSLLKYVRRLVIVHLLRRA